MERITIGSIRQARASDPAKPDCWKRRTQIVKMNSPMTIDGTPVITSDIVRITAAPLYNSFEDVQRLCALIGELDDG